MALRVGELYASLSLRTADFDRGLDQSKGKFDGLKNTVGNGVQAIGRAFAGAVTATAALGAAALKVGISYNRMQQSSRAALVTLLGSAEAANAQMDKLDEFASKSPFAKDVFIRAQQQLLGFGVAAEDVVPALDAIQNAVAAMGGSNDTISSITYALSQMQSQGKLSGETLRDLGVYGIDAASVVGEAMGKTGAEIREMASKPGGIPVDVVWDPLVNGLLEKFGGATDGMKAQFDGATDRVKAAWRDIGSVLAAPFVDPKGGGMAVEWTNKFADAMRAAQGKAAPLVDLLVTRFAPGLAAVTPLLERVRGAINSWDLSKVNGQLDSLSGYAPLIAGTSAALFALGTTNLPILSTLGITGINPVVAGLAALVATSPDARAALGDLSSTMKPLVSVGADLAKQVGDVLMYAIERLVPELGALAVSFADAGVNIVQAFAPALLRTVSAAKPVVDVIADLVGWVSDLPTPVLAGVAAFAALRAVGIGTLITGAATAFQKLHMQASNAAVGTRLSALAAGEVKLAFSGIGGAARSAGSAMLGAFGGPLGLAIMGITAALSAFVAQKAEMRALADEYKSTLDEMGNVTEETTDRIISAITETRTENWLESLFGKGQSIRDRANEFGLATSDIIGYIEGEEAAIQRVIAATDAYVEANSESRRERKSSEETVRRFTSMLDDEREGLARGAAEAKGAAEANRDLGRSQGDAAAATDRHTKALQDQQDQIQSAYDATLNLAEAQLREKDAQDRSREAIERYNTVSKDSEATSRDVERAKRDMESALLSEVGAYRNVTGAMERNNASAVDLNRVVAAQREQFIKTAVQMGINEQEAKDLATAYGLIPNRVDTEMVATGFGMALSRAQDLQNTLNLINGRTVTAHMAIRQYGQADMAHGGILQQGIQAFADGGVRGRLPAQATIQAAQKNLVQWAEPETHGEAFIPLSPAKRARSLSILDEVARRFGLVTVPATSYADGTADSRTSRSPAPQSFSVSAVARFHPDDLRDLASAVAGALSAGFGGAVSDFDRFARMGG